MQYRTFGRTGWKISDIGYGLWGMSGWSGSDDQAVRRRPPALRRRGCTFFDSAWAYGEGKSDRLLGDLLEANPGTPPVRRFEDSTQAISSGRRCRRIPTPKSSRPNTSSATPTSFARISASTPSTCCSSTSGKTIGPTSPTSATPSRSSSATASSAPSASASIAGSPPTASRAIRTGLVDAVQVIYNIFDQAPEDELFPLCREMNIGVIARVPLDEGSLGGKMTLETQVPRRRLARPLLQSREPRAHHRARRAPQAGTCPRA